MKRPHLYKLIGKIAVPMRDVEEWALAFGNPRIVDKTDVGPLHVSTVFLGIDHRFVGDGDPLLFETMIFNGQDDTYCERTSTWGQAEKAHRDAVEIAQKQLAEANANLKASPSSRL